MSSRSATIVILSLALTACAAARGQAALGTNAANICPGSTRVPFVRLDGVRPAINVMVNGRGPYLFLFDTGAEGYARADTSLVEELHLPSAGEYLNSDQSASAATRIPQVRLTELVVGTLRFRDVVAPSRNYNGNPNRTAMSGIIGLGLFRNCLVTIDFEKHQLAIRPGRLSRNANAASYTGAGAPRVPIRLAGQLTEGEIDTGDSESFTIPGGLAASLPIEGTPRVVGTSRSANTVFEIREAPLRGSIRISRAIWLNPAIVFADPFDYINVGSGALQGRAVTIDQRSRLLTIGNPPSR